MTAEPPEGQPQVAPSALARAWRAGVQVFAAVHRDITRDAWGGPTCLGASVTHRMDGVLLFVAARSRLP